MLKIKDVRLNDNNVPRGKRIPYLLLSFLLKHSERHFHRKTFFVYNVRCSNLNKSFKFFYICLFQIKPCSMLVLKKTMKLEILNLGRNFNS